MHKNYKNLVEYVYFINLKLFNIDNLGTKWYIPIDQKKQHL
jgi:hypothetical protein